MSKETFFCHGIDQEFKEYKHKSLSRSYFFGKCVKCGKHFFIKDGKIIEGKQAKEEFKFLKNNLVMIKHAIQFLKSLCFAVPARKTKVIYAKDEFNKVKVRDIHLKNGVGKIVLDSNKEPIIIDRKKVIEEHQTTEYQLLKINNKGKDQTISNTLELVKN